MKDENGEKKLKKQITGVYTTCQLCEHICIYMGNVWLQHKDV